MLTCLVIVLTMPQVLSQVKLGLDLKGGFEILYEAHPVAEGSAITQDALRQTARSLEERVDALGTSEPEIWTEGDNRIRVRLAGVDNEAKVRELLKKPAELTVLGPDGTVELQGTDFKESGAVVVRVEGFRPAIQVEVKDKAVLEELSARLLHQTISFTLDDRVLTSPVVLAVMDNGIMQITGDFPYEEASEIADIINMGALPLKLTEKYNQSVGASLGSQSLEQTLWAGGVGSVLILLFMLIVYRLPGLVASFTLITYSWLLMLCFNWVQATMTLPGIAAFVLGIGMAVDANIITYERLKEELRSGKSLLSSVREGAKHSSRSILDANVTTLVAGLVMFMLGSGAIKGFAVTLILSIVLSVLTNVYLSQWLLRLLVSSGLVQQTRWFGANLGSKSVANASERAALTFDFVRRTRVIFWASLVIAALGIGSLAVQGLNYGVDFKAGTSLDLLVPGGVAQSEAEHIVGSAGYEPSVLTVGGEGGDRVSLRFDRVLDPESGDADLLREAFASSLGQGVSVEANTVDPEMAREFARKAVMAVMISSLGILFYVWVRFDRRFAAAAIVTLVHDVFVVVALFSLLQLEVNLPFIAALLTIIGYSINDTVVIFDRIRENLQSATIRTRDDLRVLVNASLNQTLLRSLNTILCVLFACVAILLWGSESIRLFSLAMTVGLLAGMYSSIYIASQLWLFLTARKLRSEGYSGIGKQEHYQMRPLERAYED
ncbi:protein translocase subunit SecDF [Paenibacillus daejeonensis]|uniref:protein translocase subunit SecDF n=1 Tax=Paenibacillus daejeonensis TaxID=135193 RepID=UPI0003755138|nr:protein translocase subunit SecDF [Paenibacillus daejeonensis]